MSKYGIMSGGLVSGSAFRVSGSSGYYFDGTNANFGATTLASLTVEDIVIGGNLTVPGNLLVEGDTVTQNVATWTVEDHNIVLGYNSTGSLSSDLSLSGAGITVTGSQGDKTFSYSGTSGSANWLSNQNMDVASGKVYKINNTSVLSATTLGSSVVGSSLTSVGTITSGVWNGTAITNANLANSSTSFGGVSVSLGAADATPAFNLSDATAYPGDNALLTVGALDAGSITSNFGDINIGSSTFTTTGTAALAQVSATGLSGTLATAAQPNVTALGTIASLVATSAKVSDLTSGRVTMAGADGELQDNPFLLFSANTLTAANFTSDNVNIGGGEIDGTPIGANARSTIKCSTLDVSGSITPETTNVFNLGSEAKRFANVYTGDLHLKNERGNWTIFEESDHLRVRNNLTGKMFKMGLTPIEE